MKNKSNRLLYTLEVLLGVILMEGVFFDRSTCGCQKREADVDQHSQLY